VPQVGNFPAHVGSAVFERLQVIRDAIEWDRCLIMDHDMLALCDLAPYFEEDFQGNLLMGRMFGPGNTLGHQMTERGGLPIALSHAADYPYFYMGPMMNLKAMREDGTWEKLLAAQKELGQEEQMALTIASGGRVKGVGRKWNLVPHWDNLAEGPDGVNYSKYGTEGEPENWKDGLPEGIIHWTGWAKPWNLAASVWRPDLWESEETSWEALRNGWWDKPKAIIMVPQHRGDVFNLAKRGWKLLVWQRPVMADITPACVASERSGENVVSEKKEIGLSFPDVEIVEVEDLKGAVSAGLERIEKQQCFGRSVPVLNHRISPGTLGICRNV
jgi:lipopolysaccharide biosynthesis glycosyltransferase